MGETKGETRRAIIRAASASGWRRRTGSRLCSVPISGPVGGGKGIDLHPFIAAGGSAAARRAGAAQRPKAVPWPRRSVLVVDDDPLVLQALELLLQSWGLRVQAARSCKYAEELLETMDRPPDIVLADYTLAHGELGTDVIAAARRMERRRRFS